MCSGYDGSSLLLLFQMLTNGAHASVSPGVDFRKRLMHPPFITRHSEHPRTRRNTQRVLYESESYPTSPDLGCRGGASVIRAHDGAAPAPRGSIALSRTVSSAPAWPGGVKTPQRTRLRPIVAWPCGGECVTVPVNCRGGRHRLMNTVDFHWARRTCPPACVAAVHSIQAR